MIVKNIQDEDYINYKKPCMFIGVSRCWGKCWKELGLDQSLCQNDAIRSQKDINIDDRVICERYLSNPLTSAIVIAGLEPFDTYTQVLDFVSTLRVDFNCHDTVVIYTGYREDEVRLYVDTLRLLGNMVVKYGRYDPVHYPQSVFDPVLGVVLSTDNQYAVEYPYPF